MTVFDFRALGFGDGEAAVVTGAGNGIGKAVALALAISGVTVVAWDVNEEALAAVVEQIEGRGGAVLPVIADVSQQDAIERGWERTGAVGIPIPYLVNNAGPTSSSDLDVGEGVRVAIGSYAAMTEQFLGRHGDEATSITFTSSISGNFQSGDTAAWYPAAKAGIVGYMRHVAATRRGRPRANAVAPGPTLTLRTTKALESPELREHFKTSPLGRPAAADEIAAGICFLLSPAASYINGVLLPIDGGSICVGSIVNIKA